MGSSEFVTIRCPDCGRSIRSIAASAGVSTAICEFCLRTREGLPIPPMDVYNPDENLAVLVGRAFNDDEIVSSAGNQQKVMTEIPKSIFHGIIDKITQFRLKKDDIGKDVPGTSAETIAKNKRREPLF